ncbi:GrpB family protein [Salinicoccus sp. YB14-2]|uniref:GrpB family protein n=1 Tax=Salinicoccus sp. YB14-2 TaxID=1572701 RepID=UPI00068A8810|nr:GrpB family protein [Salinicoccus sp. YB14-2]
MRSIKVVNYNDQWPRIFEEEKEKLEAVLKVELMEIYHIGSTSVPGLKAKPIIDIMPVVKNIEDVDRYEAEMAGLGYESLGENGIAGRRYFRKGGDERSHHVHVFEEGSEDITRHLSFRDYLREHQEVRFHYENLKMKLASEFPNDIGGYMDRKNQFIQETEQTAMIWYKDNKQK